MLFILYSGTISANFIMAGNSPVVKDLLKISTNTLASGSMISFCNMLLMLSWPLLILDGRALTNCIISISWVGVKNKLSLFDCRSFSIRNAFSWIWNFFSKAFANSGKVFSESVANPFGVVLCDVISFKVLNQTTLI